MSSFVQNMGKAARDMCKTLETVHENKDLPCTHAFNCFKKQRGGYEGHEYDPSCMLTVNCSRTLQHFISWWPVMV